MTTNNALLSATVDIANCSTNLRSVSNETQAATSISAQGQDRSLTTVEGGKIANSETNTDLLHTLNQNPSITNFTSLVGSEIMSGTQQADTLALGANAHITGPNNGLPRHPPLIWTITGNHQDKGFLKPLPQELKDAIYGYVLASYAPRFVEPVFGGKTGVIVRRTEDVVRQATRVVLPFPIAFIFKDSFAAIQSISTVSFILKVDLGAGIEYKSIHIRPIDRLYIHDFHTATSVLATYDIADQFHEAPGIEFSTGITTLHLHPEAFLHYQDSASSFIRTLHRFPHLEEISMLRRPRRGCTIHMREFRFQCWSTGRFDEHCFQSPRPQHSKLMRGISYAELTTRSWTEKRLRFTHKCVTDEYAAKDHEELWVTLTNPCRPSCDFCFVPFRNHYQS